MTEKIKSGTIIRFKRTFGFVDREEQAYVKEDQGNGYLEVGIFGFDGWRIIKKSQVTSIVYK